MLKNQKILAKEKLKVQGKECRGKNVGFAAKESKEAIHLLDVTLSKVLKFRSVSFSIGKAGRLKLTSQNWGGIRINLYKLPGTHTIKCSSYDYI